MEPGSDMPVYRNFTKASGNIPAGRELHARKVAHPATPSAVKRAIAQIFGEPHIVKDGERISSRAGLWLYQLLAFHSPLS